MRYCDKCGATIMSGGHKSAAQGLFSTPYLCDECYAKETDAQVKAIGCFAKVFIGILVGLAMTAGMAFVMSKIAAGLSDDTQMKLLIGVEVVAILCFLASKIGAYRLSSRSLRFFCSAIAYFTFWMSLVLGVGMYFILKYA